MQPVVRKSPRLAASHCGVGSVSQGDGTSLGVEAVGSIASWWSIDPADTGEVPRTTLGVPDRRARLRAIGNGQVPQCAIAAFRALLNLVRGAA